MTTKTTTSLKTILCPVDFSLSSEKALIHVADQHAHNANLVVLHVGHPDSGDHGTLLKEQLHHFSRFSDMLSSYGCNLRFAVEYGSPAEVIIAYAKNHNIDLIILGSHGANNIPRLLVGSTTETVMRKASCQVLVLKSPDQADAGSGFARQNIAVS